MLIPVSVLGGAGSAFNGGEITEPLEISPTDLSMGALVINAAAPTVHASLTAGTGDASVLFTAVVPGFNGVSHQLVIGHGDPNTPLTVAVVNPGAYAQIQIALATDGAGDPSSTAAQVIAAVNGDVEASAYVSASLPPGTDGSDIMADFALAQLTGGGASGLALDLVPDAGAGIGEILAQWRNTAGTVVAHFDNDGGGGMSSDRVTWSELGNFTIDQASTGSVGSPLTIKIDGAALIAVNVGSGYGTVIGVQDPDDRVLVVAATTAQAANLIEAHDEDDALVFSVGPTGAVEISPSDDTLDYLASIKAPADFFDNSPNGMMLRLTDESDNAIHEFFVEADYNITAQTGFFQSIIRLLSVDYPDSKLILQSGTEDSGNQFIQARNSAGAVFIVKGTGQVYVTPSSDEIAFLVESVDNAASQSLLVNAAPGQTGNLIEVDVLPDGNPGFRVGPTGAVTISPTDPTVIPLVIALPEDQAASVLEVRDHDANTLVTLTSAGDLNITDASHDHLISFSPTFGFTASSPAGTNVSFSTGGGIFIRPRITEASALYLDGTELVPADGGQMIIMVNPATEHMPDGFYGNNQLTINADLTHGAAKLLLKAKDSTGSMVTAEIPLT